MTFKSVSWKWSRWPKRFFEPPPAAMRMVLNILCASCFSHNRLEVFSNFFFLVNLSSAAHVRDSAAPSSWNDGTHPVHVPKGQRARWRVCRIDKSHGCFQMTQLINLAWRFRMNSREPKTIAGVALYIACKLHAIEKRPLDRTLIFLTHIHILCSFLFGLLCWLTHLCWFIELRDRTDGGPDGRHHQEVSARGARTAVRHCASGLHQRGGHWADDHVVKMPWCPYGLKNRDISVEKRSSRW